MDFNYVEEFKLLYGTCDNTERAYEYAINAYMKWCAESYGWNTQEEVVQNSTKRSAIQFLNHLANSDLSPVSVNQKHSGLKSFFQYLCELDYRDTNVFENIKRQNTKMIEQETNYITKEEYENLINVIRVKTTKTKEFQFCSSRDTLLYMTLFTCGLRIEEALSLRFVDFDLVSKTIRVVGKGSKFRRVPITEHMEYAFNAYSCYREERGGYDDSDYIFVSIYGNKMNRKDTTKNLMKYAKRAGINKDLSNHDLRHSCATNYIRQGVDVARVATLLGHSSVQTTSRYTHLDVTDLDFVK